MRRTLAVLGLSFGLTALAATPGAFAGGSQNWQGTTSQGLPMSFTLVKSGGTTYIGEWEFRFEVHCLTSGTTFIYSVAGGGPRTEVVNGRFRMTIEDSLEHFSWRGSIGPGTAAGTVEHIEPALVSKTEAEVCTTGSRRWHAKAQLGGSAPALAATGPTVRVELVNHPDGTMTRTLTRTGH